MSFLKITPYLKVGETLTSDMITSNGTLSKGKNVTADMVSKANGTVITLKVISNPSITRNYTREKVQTYNTNGKSAFMYFSTGDAGYTFTVKCLISKKDVLSDNRTVFYYLQYYYTNCFNVSVVADTEVIPNGVYTISDFTEYEAIRPDYYEIEIEFTKYQKVSGKLTNKCTVLQSYLKSCKKPKHKVYTLKQVKNKKAKSSECIGYVNKVLYNLGYWGPTKPKKPTKKGKSKKAYNKALEDYKAASKEYKNRKKTYNTYYKYFTKYTQKGLKRFQKKWNKKGLKPKLNEKGTLSNNTWAALKRYPEVK